MGYGVVTGGTVAWGDESMRQNANPRMYLMCATVFGEGSEEGLEALVRAKPRSMRKLHWRDLTSRAKPAVVEAMAQIPQWSTVVVATPLNLARQERGRRKALEVLLPALEERGVTQLNLESRWVQEDQFDIDMVRALRSRRVIRDIRVDHVSSDERDARLWMPDQVLGAVGDILCGAADTAAWSRSWDEIDPHVSILLAPL